MFEDRTKTTALLAAVVFLVSIDRLFKALAVRYQPEINLFGSWFRFVLAKNSGIAFSLSLNRMLVLILTWLIILGLVGYFIFLMKKAAVMEAVCVLAIILGAGSNLLDRLKHGYVVDYFSLNFYSVFNLADAMIFLGLFGLFFYQLTKKKP